MRILQLQNMMLSIDHKEGRLSSLVLGGKERVTGSTPLFKIGLRNKPGVLTVLSAFDACTCRETEDGAVYSDFKHGETVFQGLSVQVFLADDRGNAAWRIAVHVKDQGFFAEWVDFPLLSLPALSDNNQNGDGGRVLLPYNEGVLISDAVTREMTDFRHWEPAYPSLGCYPLFPNMISAQMMAYLWDDVGL